MKPTPIGWTHVRIWESHLGDVELWEKAHDQKAHWQDDGRVEVRGPVPNALDVCYLPEYADRLGYLDGNPRRTPDEVQLLTGLTVTVDGHSLTFTMPTRGWSRSTRHLTVTIDGVDHDLRPRTYGSTELLRPDGTAIWRTTIQDRWLDDEATPIEVTVAALCELEKFKSRVNLQPFRYL